MLPYVVVALHIFAVVFWIGGITVVGWLLANRSTAPSPEQAKTAAELALGLYRKVAAPAFVLAFTLGIVRFLLSRDVYQHAHWFHAKFTLALIVIGLHHVLGARAARAANGADSAQIEASSKTAGKLTAALVLCALGVIVLVVLKGSLVP